MAGSDSGCPDKYQEYLYAGTNNNECVKAPGFDGIDQRKIFGYEICGKRGFQAFKDATRPDSQNNCPNGTSPCSSKTTAENTICTADVSQCPITDVKFILDSERRSYASQNYSISALAINDRYLATSTSATNNLPIQSTKI